MKDIWLPAVSSSSHRMSEFGPDPRRRLPTASYLEEKLARSVSRAKTVGCRTRRLIFVLNFL